MPRTLPSLVILPLLVAALPVVQAAPAAAQEEGPTGPQPSATEAQPTVTIAEPVIDVGAVPAGEPVRAEFTIRNEGAAPLELVQVRPACGCTVAEYDEVIGPGESGSVTAEVDTTNIVGPNAKAITVYTNDARNPRIVLTVKSDVRPFLLADPGYARFTRFVTGEKAENAPQVIYADDFEDLEVLGVESPSRWIETGFREAAADERIEDVAGRQWMVDVTLVADTPPGPLAENLVVETNHPQQPRIEIPVSGFIRPVVAVTPPRVDFGAVDPSEGKSWGILVRNFAEAPMTVEQVESAVPGMDVEVEAIEEGKRYKVVFTPTGQMPEGPFDGTVEFSTGLPSQERFTVQLSGEVI